MIWDHSLVSTLWRFYNRGVRWRGSTVIASYIHTKHLPPKALLYHANLQILAGVPQVAVHWYLNFVVCSYFPFLMQQQLITTTEYCKCLSSKLIPLSSPGNHMMSVHFTRHILVTVIQYINHIFVFILILE